MAQSFAYERRPNEARFLASVHIAITIIIDVTELDQQDNWASLPPHWPIFELYFNTLAPFQHNV